MPTITVSGLTDAEESKALVAGKYSLEIGADTKVLTKDDGRLTLQVEMMVTEGPMQPTKDGDGESPAGRKVFDFFQLTGLESHKDGGKYAMARFKNFLESAGIEATDDIDTDELCESLRGVEIIGANQPRKDQLGEPTENWKKYFPA